MNINIIKSRIKSTIENFGGLSSVDVTTSENIDRTFRNKYIKHFNDDLLLATEYNRSNILIITSKKLIIYNDNVITEIILESISDVSSYIDQTKIKKKKLDINLIQVTYCSGKTTILKIKKKNTFFAILNILKMIHNVTRKNQ